MTTLFRLREVMESLDPPRSLRRVALEAGLGYTTAHDIYHNKTARVDLATLDRLAQTLGCEPGALIGHPATVPGKPFVVDGLTVVEPYRPASPEPTTPADSGEEPPTDIPSPQAEEDREDVDRAARNRVGRLHAPHPYFRTEESSE